MKYLFSLMALMLSLTVASGQHMFDYGDIRAGRFTARTVTGVRSMNDGEHYTAVVDGRIEKYAYRTGAHTATIFDIANHPEMGTHFADYALSADERKALISTNRRPIYRYSAKADFWVFDTATGSVKKLTEEGQEQEAIFSPDGTKVAFMRENNVYCVNLADYRVQAVTTDGRTNEIINGHTDWVYEEEYGFTRAFEFSPDGRSIAYLRFDERRVREWTMPIWGKDIYPELFTYKYPKAGEENSIVTLHVYTLADGHTTTVDAGEETDQYIPRIGWTPDGRLFFYRVNRLQNHLEVLVADANGASSVLYSERDRRYIERPNEQTVTFLPRGRFLVKSERSGYMHLYLYNERGAVIDTVTRGAWEVTRLVDVWTTAYIISLPKGRRCGAICGACA